MAGIEAFARGSGPRGFPNATTGKNNIFGTPSSSSGAPNRMGEDPWTRRARQADDPRRSSIMEMERGADGSFNFSRMTYPSPVARGRDHLPRTSEPVPSVETPGIGTRGSPLARGGPFGVPWVDIVDMMAQLAQLAKDPLPELNPARDLAGWTQGDSCNQFGVQAYFITGLPVWGPTMCVGNQTIGPPDASNSPGAPVGALVGRLDAYGNYRTVPVNVPKMDSVTSFHRNVSDYTAAFPGVMPRPDTTVGRYMATRPTPTIKVAGNPEPVIDPFAKGLPAPTIVTELVVQTGPKSGVPELTVRADRKWPDRNKRDIKMRLAIPGLVKQLLIVTEVGDVADCLWNALPSKVRLARHAKHRAGQPKQPPKPKVPKIRTVDPVTGKVKYVKGVVDKKAPGKGPGSTDHSKSLGITNKIADVIANAHTFGEKHPTDPQGRTRGEVAVECIALNEAKDRGIGALGEKTKQANQTLSKIFGGARVNLGLGPGVF